MNIEDFYVLYASRTECLLALFEEKHRQYGTAESVFQNNIAAAVIAGISPESYLMTNVAKHVAVLAGYASQLVATSDRISEEKMAAWRESMDDISVWMMILNGLLEERFQRGIAENGP